MQAYGHLSNSACPTDGLQHCDASCDASVRLDDRLPQKAAGASGIVASRSSPLTIDAFSANAVSILHPDPCTHSSDRTLNVAQCQQCLQSGHCCLCRRSSKALSIVCSIYAARLADCLSSAILAWLAAVTPRACYCIAVLAHVVHC